MPFKLLSSLLLLAGCGSSSLEERAWPVDTLLGDECFYVPRMRPEDCLIRPPCAFFDAVVELHQAGDGSYFAVARNAQWRLQWGAWPRGPSVVVTSARAAADQLEPLLRSIEVPTREGGDYCIVVRPSQSLRFNDVMDMLRGFEARRVRHVALYMDLYQEPAD